MKVPRKRDWESVTYTDDPDLPDAEQLIRVPDFLPPPEELALRPEGVKVTLTLSRDSVSYFKAQAARLKTPYQRMIRALLDDYVAKMRRQTRVSSMPPDVKHDK